MTRGPVLGLIGEEGPEVVSRILPAGERERLMLGGGKREAPIINVHGDITPRRPDMKPEDIITVSYNDINRGGQLSRAVVNILKRNR